MQSHQDNQKEEAYNKTSLVNIVQMSKNEQKDQDLQKLQEDSFIDRQLVQQDIDIVQSKEQAFVASQAQKYFQHLLQNPNSNEIQQRIKNKKNIQQEGLKRLYKNYLIAQYFTINAKQKLKQKQQESKATKAIGQNNKKVNIVAQQTQFCNIIILAQQKAEATINQMTQPINQMFLKNLFKQQMQQIQKRQRQRQSQLQKKIKEKYDSQQQKQYVIKENTFQTYGFRLELISQDTISLETLTTLANSTSSDIKQKWQKIYSAIKTSGKGFSLSSITYFGGRILNSLKNNIFALKDWIVQTAMSMFSSQQNAFTDDATLTFFFNVVWQSLYNGVFKKFQISYKQKAEIIDYKIPAGAKIGIIGDYGTGLKDSIFLMEDMIIKNQVNIIIHLGDVYYAGGKSQYQRGIKNPLNYFRSALKDIKQRLNKQVLFYSIPGNHDYYSGGLPFLNFIEQINKHQSIKEQQSKKQDASFFCLRDQHNKWQFLGIDTAYSETQHWLKQMGEINSANNGPDITQSQLKWHKQRIDQFQGSTILLSHHQLFSIHDRISGRLTTLRQFSNFNPKLVSKLFSYYPYTSAWFWGHEHSIMFFQDNIIGLEKGRLLGNSSFHVKHDKYNPYSRHQQFPRINIKQNWLNQKKQKISLIPSHKSKSNYYDLSYAVIYMPVFNNLKTYEESDLQIKYYCTPGFLDSKQKELDQKFAPYLLYNQKIQPFHKIHSKKHIFSKMADNDVFLLTELGLFVSIDVNNNLKLNLEGVPLKVEFIEFTQDEANPKLKVKIFAEVNHKIFYLSIRSKQQKLVSFVQKNNLKDKYQIWEIWFNFNEMKKSYPDRKGIQECKQKQDIKLYDSFWLYHSQLNSFLQLDCKQKQSQTFVLRPQKVPYQKIIMSKLASLESHLKENALIFMFVSLSDRQRITYPGKNGNTKAKNI